MTTMEKREQQAETTSGLAEELLQIKGIGQATAQALNQVGIFRLSDLALRKSEDLANSLKAIIPGMTSQRIDREDWVGQAIALTAGRNQSAAPVQPAAAQPVGKRARHDEDWYELSDFFVSFGYAISQSAEKTLRTKVDHSQTGQSERWDGIAKAELLDWMLSHANLPEPEHAEAAAAPAPDQPASSATGGIELSELQVAEVGKPIVINRRLYSSAMRAECTLALSDTMRGITYDQSPFSVELHLVNLRTRDSKRVSAYSAQFEPGNLVYKIAQDFPPPSMGLYQLFVSARLLPPSEAATQIQGPVIRVEA